ncbi:hypothetical protein BC831DRAFT_441022 [Entophlyctis helioformis]|nr:hypothetical protein BC831DRAFT_441022 [Entophlyctis helioformis]
MTCCGPAKWKREEIPDHKFDYVDVDDFVENTMSRRFSYFMVFVYTLKSILVYMADLGVLALLLASGAFLSLVDTSSTPTTDTLGAPGTSPELVCNRNNSASNQPFIKFFKENTKLTVGLIAASIALSFVLLALDWRKALAVIRSRDISYAFTSLVAYRYYVIRSYPHFCFFSQIQNSRKTTDLVAFYVFFRFKGWTRLILAEMPRQFLNAINIYIALESCSPTKTNEFIVFRYFTAYGKAMTQKNVETTTKAALVLSTVTVTIWLFSFLSLLFAFFLYIPLLFTIRGNLKEYCVHKVDKRIGELLRRKSRKRIQEARKAEMKEIEANRRRQAANGGGSGGDAESIKTAPPVGLSQRPTLPDIDVDLENDYRGAPPSTHTQHTYNQHSQFNQPRTGYAPSARSYAPSLASGYAQPMPVTAGAPPGTAYGSAYVPYPASPTAYSRGPAHGPPGSEYSYQPMAPMPPMGQMPGAPGSLYGGPRPVIAGPMQPPYAVQSDYTGSEYGDMVSEYSYGVPDAPAGPYHPSPNAPQQQQMPQPPPSNGYGHSPYPPQFAEPRGYGGPFAGSSSATRAPSLAGAGPQGGSPADVYAVRPNNPRSDGGESQPKQQQQGRQH